MPYVPPLLPSVPIPAVPPDLPVRAETDQGGPDHVTKASVVSEDARGLTLSGVTVSGKPVSIAVRIVAPGIVRVLLEGEDADANRTTLARDLSAQPAAASLEKATGQRTLVTDLVRVKVRPRPLPYHVLWPRWPRHARPELHRQRRGRQPDRVAVWLQRGGGPARGLP
ncbi:MAG: hypothetical protein M5R40_12400 [Anaerolineae bacterium]|nr:hypothetical protein [Anaerolineae bacterium]